MAVRRVGGRYAVEFELRGHRVFRRLPVGATKGQADEYESNLRREIINQAVLGKRPNVTLEYAIKQWLEEVVKGRKAQKATSDHASRVLDCVAGFALAEYARAQAAIIHSKPLRTDSDGPEDCRRDSRGANDVLRRPGNGTAAKDSRVLSAATINRRLCILKAVAKFAWRKGWTEENLSARIQLLPEKKYQRREVTPDMARSLIEHASTPRAKALIALSAYTGLRLGEVLKLKPVNVRNGALHLTDTKNGSNRVIPILPGLEPHLAQLPFKAGWRNVYRGFERAREKAGLDIRYHDLRHMVGTALHEAGYGSRTIMDILGHSSVQTSARYIHPSQEGNRKALGRALSKLDATPSKSHQKGSKGSKKAA